MNALAAKSGLSQSFISMFESQPANPTIDTLLRISEALGLDAGEILTQALRDVEHPIRAIPPKLKEEALTES